MKPFSHTILDGRSFRLWTGHDAEDRLREHLGEHTFCSRWPHHTCSLPALTGSLQPLLNGGFRFSPGELHLAGSTKLILADAPEFKLGVLEGVLAAWRAGALTYTINGFSLEVPIRCSIDATAQACPCGFRGRPNSRVCSCTDASMELWKKRIDRIRLWASGQTVSS